MEENNKNNVWIIISMILLFLLIISLGFFISHPKVEQDFIKENKCIECPETIEDKAILDVNIYDWGYNEYNPDEMLFDYWIMNYGDIEAKNIKVICKLSNTYSTIFSATDFYGNLASRSVELGEFTPKKTSLIKTDEEYSSICYIKSCDNCEILYKRIPYLIESWDND